ncbi:hypothetical protein QCD60_29615 [Pokkaliibacter sp. MBI-7]|uniref:hypothetical protein n=1 Tax=Pokkaliibacter sp. MBI-7 TaxID=3040600 RepID=UPI00244D4EEE|nr:hypothetical protein [Pokkaliibacter sp. MBI-7]MDH2430939.1 hypothetical protein [Pokkaliibacter sp. MBI-7]MDH2434729.1 hypothetical protein [Pokkaliibacter sp. MBI-7]MDH2434768.1 hypothetical protein [Pokkaliibacter sp. MBI-7]MDH2436676.1 hypothetical protein [Pokkaliibacter sp. MBI-7]
MPSAIAQPLSVSLDMDDLTTDAAEPNPTDVVMDLYRECEGALSVLRDRALTLQRIYDGEMLLSDEVMQSAREACMVIRQMEAKARRKAVAIAGQVREGACEDDKRWMAYQMAVLKEANQLTTEVQKQMKEILYWAEPVLIDSQP